MGIIGNDKKIIMKFKVYLAILFFLSFFSKAFSQSSFTPEPEKFLKDFNDFIGNYDKSIAKKYVKSFEPLWLGDFFTPDNKALVYALLNSMEEKKLNVYPDFINYFNAIYNYSSSEMSSEKFEQWNSTLDNIIKKYNNKRVQDFLKVSNNLFLDGTIYVTSRTQKAATRWQVSKKENFDIQFVKKIPIFTFNDVDLRCFSKNDSSVIRNTLSVFPLTSQWQGNGGKIDWQRAKKDKDIYYAKVNSYNIGLKSSSYYIDSVLFYSSYFDYPIMGKLTEKVLSFVGIQKLFTLLLSLTVKGLILKM